MDKITETQNYIIRKSKKYGFALFGKAFGREYFMNGCELQTPLIIAARNLEKRLK